MATLTFPSGSLRLIGVSALPELEEPSPGAAQVVCRLDAFADLESLDAFHTLFFPPTTCLSCGAKTQPDGSLPCGH